MKCESIKSFLLPTGEKVIVSAKDYPIVRPFTWCRATKGHVQASVAGKHITLHRFIASIAGWNIKQLDHRNRNGLDNRRSNLRPATTSQNNANRKKLGYSTNKYKGVFKTKIGKSWSAFCTKNKQRIYLGNYPTELEAAKAYDFAANILHGEFAYTNNLDLTGFRPTVTGRRNLRNALRKNEP